MKRTAGAAIAAAVATTVLPATAARADGGFLTCAEQGHPTITPGLTTTPQKFTFDENGAIGPCAGPGGENLTGRFIVNDAHGEGTCAAIQFSGLATISWSDGTSSPAQATGRTVGNLVLAEATISSGRFAGGAYRFLAMVLTTDPLACAGAGLREADVRGSISFTDGAAASGP